METNSENNDKSIEIEKSQKKRNPLVSSNLLDKLFAFKLFKPRYSSSVAKNARKKIAAFKELKTINADQKQKTIYRVRRSLIQLAALSRLKGTASLIVLIPFSLLYLAIFFSAFFIVPNYFNYSFSSWESIMLALTYFAYIIASLIIYYGLLIIPINQFNNNQSFSIWGLALVAVYGLFLRLSLISTQQPPDFIILFLLASLLPSVVVVVFMLFVFLPLVAFIDLLFKRYQYNKYPDMVVLDRLIATLVISEKEHHGWTDMNFKRKVLQNLEEIAYCIEHYFFKKLRTGDAITDIWLEKTTKEISAGFRGQKKWVITPKNDTREEFLLSLSNKLFQLASGNWDALEKAIPEQISQTLPIFRILLHTIRVLFVGVLPFLVIWFIQKTSLSLEPTNLQYVLVGAIIWTILSVVVLIDPFYAEKISTLQNIFQLLPGAKKDK